MLVKRFGSFRKVLHLSLAVSALALLLPSNATAEYLGLIAGREATLEKTGTWSAELGIATGELGERDYQNIAARISYLVSPELLISGTVGVSEFDETNGVPIGLAATYFLSRQRISDKIALAGRASYHFGEFSVRNIEGDLDSLALEVLVSGTQPLMQNGLSWYTQTGYHRISVDFGSSDATNELGLGAGLVLPNALGEAYLGFEFIDDLTIGLGIRYFVR